MVLIALQDRLLDDTYVELQQSYPERQFRKVGEMGKLDLWCLSDLPTPVPLVVAVQKPSQFKTDF